MPPSETFPQDCRNAALRAIDWLESQIGPNGSLGSDAGDLAAYYKAPAALLRAGRPGAAYRVLDYVLRNFRQPDGSFWTSPGLKTADPVLSQYPGYLDGWLVLGAQRGARFDVSLPGWNWLRRFQHPTLGAALLMGPWTESNPSQLEVLMTSHLGLAALHCGALEAAVTAGDAVARFYALQPEPQHRLLLRMDANGALVSSFPEEAAGLHVVEARKAGQAWFFVGYPMAFLALLHQATGEPRFLEVATQYGAFALRCGERLTSEHFGHKVGWGAALLARITGHERWRSLAVAVASHLMATQAADGGWLEGQQRVTRLDQSAEVAGWLLEIAALL